MKTVALFARELAHLTRYLVVRRWNVLLGLFPRALARAQRHSSRSRFGSQAALQMLCAAIAICAMCAPVFSQVNTGRILGTVTDQSGGAIAGAAVSVTNSQTGVARNLTTDAAAEYLAPNLNPGTYTVRCTAMGFQAFERQNVQLDVGQDARVDCQLTPGQVTQTIQVTESALQLDTTSAVLSGTINTQTILDVPLNGRDFEQLLSLRPGVVQTPGGGSLTTATNGLPPQFNNYFIEGLDNNEPFTGQSVTNTTLPFGGAASLLPVDAIQELNVETNSPAEFGRRPGAVINVGIKSGTNNLHGSAYAFGRDGSWDAQDFAHPRTFKQPLEMEQWGGTVGGPIKKDKLFFFGGFERQSVNVGNAFPSIVPTTASIGDPSQSIPDAEAALAAHKPAIPVSPVSVKLLPLFGPNNTNSSSVTIGFPNIYSINNAVGKVDYHLSDHHTITGSYFYGRGHALGEDNSFTQQSFETIGDMRAQFLSTSWTWTPSSTWVNDLRFGWNHYDRTTNVGDYQTPSGTYGLNTGVTGSQVLGLPNIPIGNFNALGGNTNNPKTYGPASDYDFVDHVSYLHGKHAFKFGADMFFYRLYYDAVSAGRGQINFSGGNAFTGSTPLEDFLAGDADNPAGVNLLEGDPARNFREWDVSGFFEDSWRAMPRLTVNLGVRYEYYTPLSETKNLIGNWSPTAGFEQVGVNIKSPYNADPKDISPRIGIAWDVTGKGTTVVRAGGGLYFAEIVSSWFVGNVMLPGRAPGISSIPTGFTKVLPDGTTQAPLLPVSSGGIGSAVVTIPGTSLNWNQTGGGTVYPASALGGTSSGFVCGNGLVPTGAPAGTPKNPPPCSILATDSNLPAPRVASWNVGIQRALTPTLSAEVDYIGNHGDRLPSIVDLNQVNPNSAAEIANGHKDAIQDLPYYSKFPYLQYIDFLTDTDYSNYNALEATLTARNFHRLSFIAGYTYSRALTDEQGTGYTQRLPQDSTNPTAEYGPSNFDLRHHFSFTPTYSVPSRKAPLQLLSGWSLQSAVLVTSGFPWSVRESSRNITGVNEQADRWDFYGNPSDFTAGPNGIPFYASGASNMPAVCNTAASALASAGGTLARGCFSQGNSALIAPTAGFFGTTPRNFFRGANYADWDFSVFKNTTLFKERLTAQFRVEMFNILNHPNYAGPDGNPSHTNLVPASGSPADPTGFGCACSTPDQSGTNPYLGTGAARELQLGLKLIF